ncbi:hypothetical protein [Salinicola lusitanus]|nr:hypothetical protein [Salinicola lusitanus]
MSKMDRMPVGHAAFGVGEVLAHRRDDDAIGQFQVTERERREQLW